ncbi:Hypothetical protein I595_991 [Croceitalea dokdonensis DOKDO 023]|uniref:Uncharacterized protein n=1 Tax=Croceitalea dokdonensis DOKDO 023 TaxID=1300341 RepID=A0A0P7AL40_9FLAO|nr:Hypothetical protein I595_991 [Croceitalea dokdonensis DOKDO 023]
MAPTLIGTLFIVVMGQLTSAIPLAMATESQLYPYTNHQRTIQ